MVSAFGSGKPAKSERWITLFPRFDRGSLARLGVLQPGKRTEWVVRDPKNPASATHIKLTAAADGLTISSNGQQQVVRSWYDSALPHGGLRQLFWCPCGRVCRTIYFGGDCFLCRVCLGLRYPTDSTPSGRILAVHKIADLRRNLLRARPGSRRWKTLLAEIARQHAILTADVARVRHDLRRRLKNDYRR
jgi:hypothetical protein